MCTPLDEYRVYLENLVKDKSSVLFSNGGKDYASILMSILLENTTKSVCMFCEGFRPDLIWQPAYKGALLNYLDHKDRTLHVLVNTDSCLDKEPLQVLSQEMNHRDNNTIQVRLISDEGREIIRNQFNGSLNNFAVFDDNMYRLEYDPAGFKAFGSFNQPDDSKILLDLFNKVFEISKPVYGTIA